MKKLVITKEMNMKERKARMIVNDTIEHVKSTNELKNWLLNQVTGLVVDGMTITFPWLTYEQALGYFNEATK